MLTHHPGPRAQPPRLNPSPPGLVFGKYQIVRRLAVGGMGEVFLATQKVGGAEQPVVLKALLPEYAEQPSFVAQFIDEARVAAILDHPNVVSVYDVGAWSGSFYIAMEFIRGRDLAEILRLLPGNSPMDPEAAVQIIRGAALGLHHAHGATDPQGASLGIVHRDVSPQNIMVRNDGVTKVVDFGIAWAKGRSARTGTGIIKGKIAYLAPEQVAGYDLTPAADQFSLGVVLWELLTAQRLFRGNDDVETLKNLHRRRIPRPSTLVRSLPRGLDEIVLRMLEHEPVDRYPSCAHVAESLERVLPAGSRSSARLAPVVQVLEAVADPVEVDASDFVISLDNISYSTLPTHEVLPRVEDEVTRIIKRPVARPPRQPSRPPPPSEAGGSLRHQVMLGLAAAVALATLGGALFIPSGSPAAARSEPEPELALPEPVEPMAPAEPVPPPLPRLILVGGPPASMVRVDGRLLGELPVDLDLQRGAHHLRVEAPGHLAQEEEVSFDDGEIRTVHVELERLPRERSSGFLRLEVSAPVEVSVNGVMQGSTPLAALRLRPGVHRLELVNEAAGVRASTEVRIQADTVFKVACAPQGSAARCR